MSKMINVRAPAELAAAIDAAAAVEGMSVSSWIRAVAAGAAGTPESLSDPDERHLSTRVELALRAGVDPGMVDVAESQRRLMRTRMIAEGALRAIADAVEDSVAELAAAAPTREVTASEAEFGAAVDALTASSRASEDELRAALRAALNRLERLE